MIYTHEELTLNNDQKIEPDATKILSTILNEPIALSTLINLLSLNERIAAPKYVNHEVRIEGNQPDLVFYDIDHNPRIIVENKFWSDLTHAQIHKYFEYLSNDGRGSALVFICPTTRLEQIWTKLTRKRKELRIQKDPKSTDSIILSRRMEENRFVVVTSWQAVVRELEKIPSIELLVRELEGITGSMDATHFSPLESHEVVNEDFIHRMINYSELARTIVYTLRYGCEFCKETKPLGASDYYYYGRYLIKCKGNLKYWFGLDARLWIETKITPFWLVLVRDDQLTCSQEEWERLDLLSEQVVNLTKNRKCFPIRLQIGVGRSAVISSAIGQIESIAGKILNELKRKINKNRE